MPTYDFVCDNCGNEFGVFFKSMKESPSVGSIHNIPCEMCKNVGVRRIYSTEVNFYVTEGSTRAGQKESDHRKRVKDPDRAQRQRKNLLGSDAVSISKSPHFHKEKRIKAKGTTSDINKSDFVKMAAKNPNAVQAAIDVVNRKKG
jgi:predicted nucleic acid-binding Zn ribbon protein